VAALTVEALVTYQPDVILTPEPNVIPAINPPEYKAMGGEVLGVSQAQLEADKYAQLYRLFLLKNGLEGQAYSFTGVDQAEAQKNF
jgi:hypothetical protein